MCKLVHDCKAGWSPARHFLFHPGFRKAIRDVLTTAERLCHTRHAETSTIGVLMPLPSELWRLICGFLLREWYL